MDETMDDNIDYMHPDGKPKDGSSPAEAEPLSEDAKPSAKELDLAQHEADGHSIYKPDSFLDGDETEPPKWNPKDIDLGQ